MSSLLFFHDVLAVFGWKRGQTVCTKSAAIFALHLALSWGRDMSLLVISKMDATGSWSKSYSTTTVVYLGPETFHFIFSSHSTSRQIILSDKVWKIPPWHLFPLCFVKNPTQRNSPQKLNIFQLPSQKNCGLQCSSTRQRFVKPWIIKRRLRVARMEQIQTNSSRYDLQPQATAGDFTSKFNSTPCGQCGFGHFIVPPDTTRTA